MNQIQTLNKIFLKLFIYVIIIVNSLDNTDKYVCKNIRIKVETKLIYTLNRAWDTFYCDINIKMSKSFIIIHMFYFIKHHLRSLT